MTELNGPPSSPSLPMIASWLNYENVGHVDFPNGLMVNVNRRFDQLSVPMLIQQQVPQLVELTAPLVDLGIVSTDLADRLRRSTPSMNSDLNGARIVEAATITHLTPSATVVRGPILALSQTLYARDLHTANDFIVKARHFVEQYNHTVSELISRDGPQPSTLPLFGAGGEVSSSPLSTLSSPAMQAVQSTDARLPGNRGLRAWLSHSRDTR